MESRAQLGRKRRFLLQSGLVLLPVLGLVIYGFTSLRNERLIVGRKAVERASEIAHLVADRYGLQLPDRCRDLEAALVFHDSHLIYDTATGEILHPKLYELEPTPLHFDVAELSGEQRELLTTVRGFSTRDLKGCARFLESKPPPRLAAWTEFQMAMLLNAADQFEDARLRLEIVAARYPDSVSESGLPLLPMVKMKQMEVLVLEKASPERISAAAKAVAIAALDHPSVVSNELFNRADRRAFGEADRKEIAGYRNDWHGRERARQFGFHLPKFVDHTYTWRTWRGEDYWIVPAQQRSDVPTAVSIAPISEESVRNALAAFDVKAVDRESGIEFETVVTVAGRVVAGDTGRGKPFVTATASSVPVEVDLFLPENASIYAASDQRALWIQALLVGAFLVAVFGVWNAYRSLQKEQELSAMKSDFVSSVSHELRTPIASISLMAESLRDGRIESEEKRHDYFQLITRECRRLSGLIENVLDYSRIEQDRKRYEFAEADIVQLCADIIETMEPYAQQKQIQLIWNVPAARPEPEVDAAAIRQALVNVIDNAIKYAPRDSQVQVALVSFEDRVELSVSDEGKGIPRSEQTRIFDRFYRVGSELTRETQGAGIGLSIVKHIADAHQGSIAVKSNPDDPTIFTLTLPTKIRR